MTQGDHKLPIRKKKQQKPDLKTNKAIMEMENKINHFKTFPSEVIQRNIHFEHTSFCHVINFPLLGHNNCFLSPKKPFLTVNIPGNKVYGTLHVYPFDSGYISWHYFN